MEMSQKIFEDIVLEIYEELDPDERAMLDHQLKYLVMDVKRDHPKVPVSKTGLLTAIVAAMYYARNGESPAKMVERETRGKRKYLALDK